MEKDRGITFAACTINLSGKDNYINITKAVSLHANDA